MSRAALYLRSSKDRADVSIDAQRRDLGAFARQRKLQVVAEFADSVESGKDDDRPGFQQLIAAVQDPERGWDTLLVLDTARIARNRLLAVVFEEQECRQAGINIVYRSIPDSDPITEMLLKSFLQAIDQWHSMTSRAKGLAGMAENVRRGWRAGGRAPRGYALEHVDTGAMREGEPVRKSRLIPSHEAPTIKGYLKARIAGASRSAAARKFKLPQASLNDLEWNALTYAGHTVWNMRTGDGTTRKRRPRSEWVVQRDTHQALITDAEAEAILARLERYSAEASRRSKPTYLLTGILFTPNGKPWRGNGTGHYRTHGLKSSRHIKADELERKVLQQVATDIEAAGFVDRLVDETRAHYRKRDDRPGKLEAEIQRLNAQAARMMDLAAQMATPGPALRRVEAIEAKRKGLEGELRVLAAEVAQAEAMRHIGRKEVRAALTRLAEDLGGEDRDATKDALRGLIERITLTTNGEARIRYRGALGA